MEHIIKYLEKPIKTGVYHSQFTVDFSWIKELLRHVLQIAKKHKQDAKELSETLDRVKGPGYLTYDEIKDCFATAIDHLARFKKECPEEIQTYIIRGPTGFSAIWSSIFQFTYRIGKNRSRIRKTLTNGYKLPTSDLQKVMTSIDSYTPLDSHIDYNMNDAIVINTEQPSSSNLIFFEVTSMQKEITSRFLNFIRSVPYIGDTVTEIRKRKTHSSRYTFRPYPFIARLWLGHEETINVPKELKDFLNASIKYYFETEWRTSIVLSAIAVENILADLYEEKYETYAPDDPLGALFKKVKQKVDFPPDITEAIEKTNEARISAVHRSRFPVGDREALSTLHGATSLTMWYSSNF